MMPTWLRIALAIATGFIAWFAVATVGNLPIRWFLPGYAQVEKAMDFSLAMLFARLVLGAVASLAAGAACVAVARNSRLAVHVFSILLLALFIPVHVNLWARFPLWYHAIFLGSLVPLVILGAKLLGPPPKAAEGAP
jgi:F0F1-type ATP synthase membrane subunit c/vacuolar-type H+-ATPase subunit K